MKKTKKFTKIALASSLALFMGAGVLCSGLIFPMKTANLNALGAENSVVTNESLAEEIKSYKEDIASGKIKYAPSPLGLDPANDPVIYTTETGIEIKSSNAITNPNLTHYSYITLGSYNGYAINWLIVGMPRHVGDTNTPAGVAINAEITKNYYHTQSIIGTTGIYYDTSLAVNNYRIISECTLGTTQTITMAQNSGDTLLFTDKWGVSRTPLYANHTKFNTTLTNYKSNNYLGLDAYANTNIVSNLSYITTQVANNLSNKMAYAIGTQTPTSWWTSTYAYAGGSNPGKDQTVTRPVYKEICDTSGNLTTAQVGSFIVYKDDVNDMICQGFSANGATAGVRLMSVINI